ncbi:MAG: 6-pyruvoyl-tetrahydropterin synthase-related protein [Liquorilactobacillus ghanensis]|uniref:6-pyruvoyl-tetrahydropterin synthase-related protein n=1 Tax=Liquorilactobacillus ghanensis TaxID=399370 RepID=UPI0039EBC2CD
MSVKFWKFIQNDKCRNAFLRCLIFASFLVLSYFFVYPLLTKGVVFNGDDAWYHIDRIIEIRKNLQHGIYLPFVYTYTFGQIGFPLGIFYPQATLTISAAISLFFKHQVTGIYAGIAFYTLVTLILTYWVCRKIGKSRSEAYVGAVLYAFAAYRTIDAFSRFAMGEYLAMTFLPLCLYGFYAILVGKNKDWPYLAIGYSLIIMSHVLTAFILGLFMLVVWLINLAVSKHKMMQFKYFIYAGIASFFSSAFFLVPFLEQELFQKYAQPDPRILAKTSQQFSSMLLVALDNSINKGNGAIYSIGLTSIIILIAGFFCLKELTKLEKISYFVALTVFIVSSKVFPWSLVQKTPLSVIQFTFRLLVIPTLLFAIVGAGIFGILRKKYFQSKRKYLFLLIIVLGVLGGWYGSVYQLSIGSSFNQENLLYKNDSRAFNEITSTDQYTPKKSLPYLSEIQQHIAIINGKKVTLKKITPQPSELIFKDKSLTQAKKVDLPVAYYKNYVAYRNGHRMKLVSSKRNTMLVSSKETGPIMVTYHYSKVDIIAIISSVLTWLFFVAIFISGWIRKKQYFQSKISS